MIWGRKAKSEYNGYEEKEENVNKETKERNRQQQKLKASENEKCWNEGSDEGRQKGWGESKRAQRVMNNKKKK